MTALDKFKKTLDELKSYLALPIEDNRDIAGIIQAFEFTFEQSWKSIQKVAHHHGVPIASPKAAFTYALQSGWIKPEFEDGWLHLLKDRNLTSQSYQEDLAKHVLSRIESQYVGMFEQLILELSKVS